MAYEKQTWSCGDTITADKLNHIEDGIESAGSGDSKSQVIVSLTKNGDNYVADTSRADISSALSGGDIVLGYVEDSDDGIYGYGFICQEGAKFSFTLWNKTIEKRGDEYYTVYGMISDDYEWRKSTLSV